MMMVIIAMMTNMMKKRMDALLRRCNVLAVLSATRLPSKCAPTVPLIENHAATRERISLISVTDSCEERVRTELPVFELMFN